MWGWRGTGRAATVRRARVADRRAQIVRLLETRDEFLPVSQRREGAPRGFVHRVRVRLTCEDCLANDKPRPGCVTCGGSGWTETWRSVDPYAEKPADAAPARYGLTGEVHLVRRERDAEIARLGEQTADPRSEADLLAAANALPAGWERARRRMWARFDYEALDWCLDELRAVDAAAYHALHAVFVYGYAVSGNGHTGSCERGLELLVRLMPRPLRAPE